MWAHAYRDSNYYAAVDTNNGTESLNKALKYSYLPKRKSLTLSGIASLLIDRFLPDMWQKYVFHNYKLSEEYRAYSKDIPSYLKGRPKSVIFHCLERKAKCHKFTEEDIKVLQDGKFEVYKTNIVNFSLPECSCKDWVRYHIPCKHFFAVFEQCPGWDWFKLPQQFSGSCYLSADTTAVKKYLTPANTNQEGAICNDGGCSTNQESQHPLPQIPTKKVHACMHLYSLKNTIIIYHAILYRNHH